MLCILAAAIGVYCKEPIDSELRCQVQRRRGMFPCLIHFAQVSMARRKIGFDPIRLDRRAPEAFDRFLIFTRDKMNHGAVAPVPWRIEMRGDGQRLPEIIKAALGLTAKTVEHAKPGHERGTVRIEGEGLSKVVIRKLVVTAEHMRAAEHGVAEIVAVVEGHGLFRQRERAVEHCCRGIEVARPFQQMICAE